MHQKGPLMSIPPGGPAAVALGGSPAVDQGGSAAVNQGGSAAIITVAICIHDRLEFLAGVLDGLAEQTLPRDQFTILVVDNTPNPARQQELAAILDSYPDVACITSQPPGLSRARNAALAACTTPYLAYLDDDAFPEGGWLAALAVALGQHQAAIVAGPIEALWLADRPDWLPRRYESSLTILNLGPQDGWLPPHMMAWGANMSFRCDVLREAGGFDEKLGRAGVESLLGGEETELQARLVASGHRVFYAAQAKVLHCIHAERLTRPWLRSRTAWTAVTWAMQKAPQGRFANALPNANRAAAALGLPDLVPRLLQEGDAELFGHQLDLVLSLVSLLLARDTMVAAETAPILCPV
jgi:GT2 family glycosyltransferase